MDPARLRLARLVVVVAAIAAVPLVATRVLDSFTPDGVVVTPLQRITRADFVVDGDTLALESGRRVRLLQIDAPEHGECFFTEATGALRRLVPRAASIALESDAALDAEDAYGRSLVYVRRVVGPPETATSLSLSAVPPINVVLVREGAAAPYFFRTKRGRYAEQLLAAARDARRQRRGLWSVCPRARLEPGLGSVTGPASSQRR